MKHSIAAALLLVAVFVSGVVAQDYISPIFNTYLDHPLPAAPCVSRHPIAPVIYDRTLLLIYMCDDGRDLARRFFRDSDNLPDPVPGGPGNLIPPGPVPSSPPSPPSSCPGYFVAGRYGGCVPPDHPLAVR